jgi:hypothetical protein
MRHVPFALLGREELNARPYARDCRSRAMLPLSAPLRRDGQFWMPGNPDHQCFGELSFDPASGIELKLFGSLRQLPDSFNSGDVPDGLLHGRLENGALVSLFGAFRKSHQITLGQGFPKEIYRLNLAAIGTHVQSTEEKRFTSCVFEPAGLNGWLGSDWFPNRHLRSDGLVFSLETQSPVKEVILKNRHYSVLINKFTSISQSLELVSVSPKAEIQIDSATPQSIDWCLKKASALVSFLSFCLAQLTEIQFITLRYEDEGEFEHSGRHRHNVDLIYARIDHGKVDPDKLSLAPFLTLDKPKRITNEWMKLYSKAKDSIRLVHEIQSDHVKYVNLRFLLAAQAAEAFHREVFGPRNQTLRRRIDDLAARLANILGYTPGGLNKSFRDRTVKTRNYNTHFSATNKRSIFSSGEMYWASQRLGAMITIIALYEIGVDPQTIRSQLSRRDEISRILRSPGLPY